LIHFVMILILIFFVEWPDLQKASDFDTSFKPLVVALSRGRPEADLDLDICYHWAETCML